MEEEGQATVRTFNMRDSPFERRLSRKQGPSTQLRNVLHTLSQIRSRFDFLCVIPQKTCFTGIGNLFYVVGYSTNW
ncbi:hypothetical protein EG68_11679 [Paragonimus skrjabini miyazakii]|uniref:Uncharacterized protein n=1 Tax=Paragonimus skrjabini miyazakii TaxID=59628 RepID=A0A8S9YLD7_9TREM|nr:hypothetical protein EG68_11679 [Paragonimus skrjabini miyazakii]